MRNLKRALSLVMAMALIVGMMVVSASAASAKDFTDADEIQHTEAVNVMVTLNVISGKEDGSYFDPTGTLTRAEMAKIVAYVMNGGVEPNIGTKLVPTYSDIDNHWAEAYIEYCTSMGIIAGDGAGKFNPNGTLTATQTAKMFLTAMGYNAEVFGLLGDDWETNTNRYANEAGLYDELGNVGVSDPISRDDAAQMAYNAIQSKLMERTWSQNQTTGQITEGYELSNSKTLLSEKFGVVKVEGVVDGNEFTNGSAMAGKTTITAISNPDEVGTKVNGTVYNVETGADELGKCITMYVKPASSSNSSTRATVLGSAIINADNTVYTTGAALVNDASKSNDITKTLKAQGLKFEDGNAVAAYTNYAADASYTNGATAATNIGDYAGGTGAGITSTFIDNDADGIIDVVTYVVKSFGKVSTVDTKDDGKLGVSRLGKATQSLSTSTANDDVYDFANLGLAKDDYVAYIKVADLFYVEKVEGTTITVDSKKGADADCEVNGTYKISALASTTDVSAASGAQDFLDTALSLGKEAVLYLDEYGNVIYVDSVAADTNYLMITALDTYSTFSGSLQAKVVLQDGTTSTVKVASYTDGTHTWETDTLYVKSTIDTTAAESASGTNRGNTPYATATDVYGGEYFTAGNKLDTTTVYGYTTDSDGNYALKAVAGSSATATITKGNAGSVSGKTLNAGTIFVVKNGSSWSTYTGISNVPSLQSGTVYYAEDAGTIKVLFVAASDASTLDNTVVILGGTPVETDDDGDTVYTYNVLYKGEFTTLTASATAVTAINGKAGLYTNVSVSNGEITSAGTLVSAAEVTACADNVITTATAAGTTTSQTTYTYDDSTVVYVVEDGVGTEGTIGDITVKDTSITPNIDGSDVVVIARGSNSSTDGTKFIADCIVIFE